MGDRTLYSRLVDLKKRVYPKPVVPPRLAHALDTFFNELHGAIVRGRDRARDAAVRSRDLTRDAVVRSAALSRDSVIRAKDLSRDAVVRSAALSRDSVIRSAALSRDAAARARDLSRDAAKDLADTAREHVSAPESADGFARRLVFPFVLVGHVGAALWTALRLSRYAVTEASDQEAVRHVGRILANSRNVAARVARYYGREADVVYPPIDTERLEDRCDGGYWLSVNRITPEKRVDVQVAAFASMPDERLIVVGGHDENARALADGLADAAPWNVQFVGAVSDDELIDLYGRCRGFATTARDEDFGMTAVEAMAAGKPVVAPAEGGYMETVEDGRTGALLGEATPEALAAAVRRVSAELARDPARYRGACLARAADFSVARFARSVRAILESQRR